MDLFSLVPKSSNDSPYYFGTSDLACVSTKGLLRLIKKRSIESIPEENHNRTKQKIPKRNTLSSTHRWIYYNGTYFEWEQLKDPIKGFSGCLMIRRVTVLGPHFLLKGRNVVG